VIQLWWTSLQSSEEGKSKKEKGETGDRGASPSRLVNEQSSDANRSKLFTFSFFLLPSARRMLAAGIIAGLLPLIHAHSFLTLLMVAAFLVPWVYWRAWSAYGLAILVGVIVFLLAANYEAVGSLWIKVAFVTLVVGLMVNLYFFLPWPHVRLWLCFFVAAIIVGGPQILWSTHKSAIKTQSFIAWQFGWDSDQQEMFGSKPVGSQPIETVPPFSKWFQRLPYVAWFWFKNTGLFIPLLVIALVWKPDNYLVPRRLLLFYLPFTLAFFVPNFVKLAPWVWDNIKMLFYWWIVSAPIVALLLARLWEQHVGQKVLAASLLVMMTLAGTLDLVPLLLQQGHYGEFDRDGVAFAESIKDKTPPTATILHAPIHNTPVYLTGRKSIMGYPGHIWTHGLEYGPREQEIKQIYAGSSVAAALLAKYRVDYVVIGPHEFSTENPNVAFFSAYPEVANVGDYHLYKITQ